MNTGVGKLKSDNLRYSQNSLKMQAKKNLLLNAKSKGVDTEVTNQTKSKELNRKPACMADKEGVSLRLRGRI